MRIVSAVTLAMVIGWASSGRAEELYAKDTETYLINYMVRSKDPTAAVMLSLAPGFGAGHFYNEEYATGAVMLAGELVGLGLLLLGQQVGDSAGDVLGITGGALFAGFKIADIYLAPFSTAEYNKKLAKSLKIRAVTMAAPTPASDRLALGLGLELDLGS